MFVFSLSSSQENLNVNPKTTLNSELSDSQRAPMFRNVIIFDYDAGGNQILRNFIHVESGIYRNSISEVEIEKKLVDSDIYDDIKFYPNPVASELFVQWKNSETDYVTKMELYSINGQLIKQYDDLKMTEEININFQEFSSGYYVLNLVYASGETKNLKIIKKDN